MKQSIVTAFAIVGCIALLPGCSSGSQSSASGKSEVSNSAPAPDPKVDWVDVWGDDGLTKRCDGPTMIYRDLGNRERSIAAVPLHPECME